MGLGRDRQLRMGVEHQPQERGARARRSRPRTAPAGVRLPPGGAQARVLAMGVAWRRLFWQPRDPLRHSASDRHVPAHYPVTALVKPETSRCASRGTPLSWSPSARTGWVTGTARLRRDRRPALRHQLVVRLDAPLPAASSAPRWARRSTTSTSTGRATPPEDIAAEYASLFPHKPGQHRRRVDAALPRRPNGDPPAQGRRPRGEAPGHVPRPRRPLPVGHRPPAADGRRARRSRAAARR